ncbi:molybdopterin-binding protein [Aminivibrio sp.]|jgi:hypothetical protein|uniref:molybdopterin-binding protein n=1 Tax=Aminivibrio sp. TaxID=1872489 RepID=UPI0016902B58|nr:molybdopterin-binding protein [Synergistaceae bacterium]NLO58609.1 molybdopterin-binding protein [Synergistaceae bacterium]
MAKTRFVKIEDAVGMSLAHDMTQIVPATGYKGARYRKGQILAPDDLPVLRSMGKERISILELEEGDVHEDDAAARLAFRLAGEGIAAGLPVEGKVSLNAVWNGLLAYDEEILHTINSDPGWAAAALPDRVPVKKGELVAGIRIIPLVMREEQVLRGENAAGPMAVLPFVPLKTCLVTTGKELAEGRVRDVFAGKLKKKLSVYGSALMDHVIVGDGEAEIAGAISGFLERGAELVIATGGMSVDPDDRTGEAIASIAGEVRFRGVPVMPGAHLMLALKDGARIVGAPACVAHDEWTSLDLLLNRLFAGLIPSEAEVRRWGAGGLCRRCRECSYPNCAFAAR